MVKSMSVSEVYALVTLMVLFGLWSMVFPEYVSLRKALRAIQQDARRSSRSSAKVALSTPTTQTVQESYARGGEEYSGGS
jgi:hypothetical protein